MIAILSMRCRIRNCKQELKFLRESLTKPESYVWVNVQDHLPTQNRDYLVEYCFGNSTMRYHSVHTFYVRENRFQHEGWEDLKVVRWAELPK